MEKVSTFNQWLPTLFELGYIRSCHHQHHKIPSPTALNLPLISSSLSPISLTKHKLSIPTPIQFSSKSSTCPFFSHNDRHCPFKCRVMCDEWGIPSWTKCLLEAESSGACFRNAPFITHTRHKVLAEFTFFLWWVSDGYNRIKCKTRKAKWLLHFL